MGQMRMSFALVILLGIMAFGDKEMQNHLTLRHCAKSILKKYVRTCPVRAFIIEKCKLSGITHTCNVS